MRTKLPSRAVAILSAVALSVAGLGVYAGEKTGTKGQDADHPETKKGDHGHVEVPHDYEGKKNPHWSHLPDIIAGGNLYMANCQICHGPRGKGDGPVGKNLDPKPADFTKSKMMAETRDDYLYWRVSEGGDMHPFNSAMPAFKGSLTDNQIWQVLAYAHAFSHISLMQHEPGEDVGKGHEDAEKPPE